MYNIYIIYNIYIGDTEAVGKLAGWGKQYLATLVIPFAPSLPAPVAGGSEARRSSSRGNAASGVAGEGARAGGESGDTEDKSAVKGVRSARALKDTSEVILKSPLYSEFRSKYIRALTFENLCQELDVPFDLYCRLSRLPQLGGGREGDTSDLRFLAQDGTKCPVAQHQAKGLILHMPASDKDLVAAMEAKFSAAAAAVAAAGGRWLGPPSIWCKIRDVRIQERKDAAGAGGAPKVIGILAQDERIKCKPSIVMLPVCHSRVIEIAAALKVCLEHEAQQLEAAVAPLHSPQGDGGGGGAAAAAAAAAPAKQNRDRASEKRKAADAGLEEGPQRRGERGGGGMSGGAAVGGEVVTSAGHGGVPVKTLQQVLALTRAEPVDKFRVRVKVTAIDPPQVK
jgi:hypothetical protein